MSSWLRSSQQELCRENKSSLTASLSHRKPLFLSAGYNCSSCALQSDHGFKYVISPTTTAIDISLMSEMGDIFRHFTITFSYWNKRLQKSKLNDVFSVYPAHIFIEAVQLHHKSPGSHSWQHHGGPVEKLSKQPDQKKSPWERVLSCRMSFYPVLRDERQLVPWVGKETCCSNWISVCCIVSFFIYPESHFCTFLDIWKLKMYFYGM